MASSNYPKVLEIYKEITSTIFPLTYKLLYIEKDKKKTLLQKVRGPQEYFETLQYNIKNSNFGSSTIYHEFKEIF